MRPQFILTIIAAIGLTAGCKCFQNPSPPNPNNNSICSETISILNTSATNSVIRDIQTVSKKFNAIPDTLKVLYPIVKMVWNSSLEEIEKSYSRKDWIGLDLSSLEGPYKDSQVESLKDYQKFFLLLTEYAYGPFPEDTRDVVSQVAWSESTNAKKRLEFGFSRLKYDCQNLSDSEARKKLKLKRLPPTLEECLK